MNVYATVASERAKKSQGGRYLEIDICNERRMPYGKLFVHSDYSIELSNSKGVMVYKANAVEFSEATGEKQKSEYCEACESVPGCGLHESQ